MRYTTAPVGTVSLAILLAMLLSTILLVDLNVPERDAEAPRIIFLKIGRF